MLKIMLKIKWNCLPKSMSWVTFECHWEYGLYAKKNPPLICFRHRKISTETLQALGYNNELEAEMDLFDELADNIEIICKAMNSTSPMDMKFFLNHLKENEVVADITSDKDIMETTRAQHLVLEVGEEEAGEELPAITYEREGNNSTYLTMLGQRMKEISKDQIKVTRQTRLDDYPK
ncbi:hypothetical protein GcM3_190050 [Golovinomyces cichoracearum]|uniref:Uncharacterized protein n=1 Tax=Golovinomyces cichoracearum TaxID=62708 RepID=A0A420HIM7_9PEZI|nr:hypothetical protein GcM3_190050 [Golovinomyces cichoracearum]